MPLTVILGSQLAFGAAGSLYAAEQALQLTANQRLTIAKTIGAGVSTFTGGAGRFMVICSPNDKVQYTLDGGTTFRDFIPAGGAGYVDSDGFNFSLLNTGVADTGGVFTRLTPMVGSV